MRFGPCCDGVPTVGGGVRKAGFKGGGGVRLSFPGFLGIDACVNSGVTLRGLRGVDRRCWTRSTWPILSNQIIADGGLILSPLCG